MEKLFVEMRFLDDTNREDIRIWNVTEILFVLVIIMYNMLIVMLACVGKRACTSACVLACEN